MADENVKVAVRVRPFNSREKERGSTLIIEMDNPKTIINVRPLLRPYPAPSPPPPAA